MKSLIKSLLVFCIALMPVIMFAQESTTSSFKLTNKGVVREVSDGSEVIEKYTVLKPILIFKSKYELGVEEGDSRFSVRNSRLGFQGDVSKLVSYKFMCDFGADGKFNVLDLYATLKPSKRLSFTIGQQGLPFYNSYTIAPNALDYVNRPFVGKYFIGTRDIGVTVKYALKKEGFPIAFDAGVFNGNGTNNPQWNSSIAYGGRLAFGSMKGFRSTVKFYNVKPDGTTSSDLYWGVDARYESDDFKVETEFMSKEFGSTANNADVLSAAYLQGAYKIKVNNPSVKRVEPVLRWDAMGYDLLDRGFGANRITAGANVVFNTSNLTTILRMNFEHYFNNSMDMSALFKTPHHNEDKLSLELLLVF